METEKCDLETRLTMEMAGGVFLSQSSYNTLNKRLRRLHHLSGSEVVDLIKTEVLVPVRDLTWAPAFPPVPLVTEAGVSVYIWSWRNTRLSRTLTSRSRFMKGMLENPVQSNGKKNLFLNIHE